MYGSEIKITCKFQTNLLLFKFTLDIEDTICVLVYYNCNSTYLQIRKLRIAKGASSCVCGYTNLQLNYAAFLQQTLIPFPGLVFYQFNQTCFISGDTAPVKKL